MKPCRAGTCASLNPASAVCVSPALPQYVDLLRIFGGKEESRYIHGGTGWLWSRLTIGGTPLFAPWYPLLEVENDSSS